MLPGWSEQLALPCARLKYSWMSCSQVIAMPPCIWTASAATVENASLAANRASAADVGTARRRRR